MSTDISVENAELIGLWFQLVTTGGYLTYFLQCVTVLKHGTSGKRSSLWLHIACYLIFLSVMADQILALVRTYQAFGVHGGARPDPTTYYADPANSLAAAKNSFNIVLTLISDAIIVYRTFVLWNLDYRIIIIPVAIVLANIALGVLAIVALLGVHSGDDLIRSNISVRFRYYFVLTFVLNIVCAGLICWKLWRINSKVSRHVSSHSREMGTGRSYTSHIFEVIIQSAGFYCAHLLMLIITDAVGTNAFFIFLDPLPPVAATVFSTLILRARHPYSMSHATMPGTMSSPASSPRVWGLRTGNFAGRRSVNAEVTIDLERVEHADRESFHRYGDDHHGDSMLDQASVVSKDAGEAA